MHEDWPKRNYKTTPATISGWLDSGYNVGYRIPKRVLVLDIDPRNGAGKKVREELATLFGAPTFKKLLKTTYSTRTGGGGFHLYYSLPKGVKPKTLVELHKDWPGVEFKKLGRQVIIAPSKHPNGTKYKELNYSKHFAVLPKGVRRLLKRKVYEGKTVGGGEFTPKALEELLSNLKAKKYGSNEKWEPLLMAAHHATAGIGIEEFVEWSRKDKRYDTDDNEIAIRTRWDSCDTEKNDGRTYKTLCYELELTGKDSKGFRARAEFRDIDNKADPDEEVEPTDEDDEDDTDDDIDIIKEANRINASSSYEDVMLFIRRANYANKAKAVFARSIAKKNTHLSSAEFNQLVKESKHKAQEDLPRKLAEYVLAHKYNEGKHITYLNNGSLWVYESTHWRSVTDEYLRGRVLASLDRNYRKLVGDGDVNQNSIVKSATDLIKMRVAGSNNDLIEDTKKLSIINCVNGELWLKDNGKSDLKKHKATSQLISVLPLKYASKARCSLWEKTILQIMSGDKDMVRHIQEIFGYALQPNKDIASWFLFRGQGGDGKSTVLAILSALMGNGMLKAHPSLLSMGTGNGNNHASASLVSKLCVAIEELSANSKLPDSAVKMLSEKSIMEANPKGKDAFNFTYVGVLIMCCNGWPRVIDLSEGMQRRANVIEFEASFTKRGKEKQGLADRIIEQELPGVMQWALEGLERLRKRGKFDKPEKCIRATNMWFGKSHIVTFWLSDAVELRKRGKTELKEAYESFTGWCFLQGIDKVPGKIYFRRDIESLGYVVSRGSKNKTYISGLDLKK